MLVDIECCFVVVVADFDSDRNFRSQKAIGTADSMLLFLRMAKNS